MGVRIWVYLLANVLKRGSISSGRLTIPFSEPEISIKGKVGEELTLDQAYKAAERCGLSLLAHAKKACDGDLEKIKSCVKLTGYVNSSNNFNDQPKVINGASDLISQIFGDSGKHTRAAISVNSLPLGAAVEIDAIFEI